MEDLWWQLRIAARRLRRSPIYSSAALGSLTLAIGATIATFTLVDAVVLRPPPWRNAHEIVLLNRVSANGTVQSKWSHARFRDVAQATNGLAQNASAFATRSVTMTAQGNAIGMRVAAEFVTDGYAALTGMRAVKGRLSGEVDWRAVIISERIESIFGGRPLVGSTLRLNGIDCVVIGVVPRDFFGLSGRADVWLPIEGAPAVWGDPGALRDFTWAFDIALRTPAATGEGASRDRLLQTLEQAVGVSRGTASVGSGMPARSGMSSRLALTSAATALQEPGIRNLLWILLAAAVCVLILASANIASLAVARVTNRLTDVSVHRALGASKGRLAASFATEALLLGALSGVLALGLARWGQQALWALRPSNDSLAAARLASVDLSLNATHVAVAAGLSLLGAALIALWPSLAILRLDRGFGAAALGGTRSRGAGDPHAGRVRHGLSVIQIGLAVVVTMSGVLFLTGLRSLGRLDHGFDLSGVLVTRLDLPTARYDAARARVFYSDLLAGLRRLPNVDRVSIGNAAPLDATAASTAAVIDEGMPVGEGGRGTPLGYHTIDAEYFATLGLAWKDYFAGARGTDSPMVPVVVTASAARQFWPDRDPIGRPIQELLLSELSGRWTRGVVVGVAPAIRYGLSGASESPAIFVSIADDPPSRAAIVLRTSDEASNVIAPVRDVVRQLDPTLVLYGAKTMRDRERELTSGLRFGSAVLITYALIALIIAIVGVYSVVAFAIVQRQAEFGIRLALGETPAALVRRVVSRAGAMLVFGLAAGLLVSLAVQKVLVAHFFGLGPADARYYALVLGGIAAAALAASFVPACAVTRIDPATSLRAEG